MTKEQLRLICAELDGRCTHGPKDWEREGPEGDSELVCRICRISDITPPNYPEDLNAVHELKKKLIPRLKLDLNRFFSKTNAEIYSNMLKRVIQDRRCIPSAIEARYLTAQATATEECEAIARLHGKWEEEEK